MISVKSKPTIIPTYNLTGDLLSYLKCPLQYRYYNKAALPPSKPVQLWFGEFIHGVMEEAYVRWREDPRYKKFPWDWKNEIREIEEMINDRLNARGLHAYKKVFCEYKKGFEHPGKCGNLGHPHKYLVSERTDLAINSWGQHLFPLIEEVEIDLKGTRGMLNYQENSDRSKYYGISGVADVISSIKIRDSPHGNLIIHYLHENPEIQRIIDATDQEEFEILIDYKGSRRPPTTFDSQGNTTEWHHHEWQILTYAGLRAQNKNSKPVIAGIIFYLNELYPSNRDLQDLQAEVNDNSTDVLPSGRDLTNIRKWKPHRKNNQRADNILSGELRSKRSIRIIPITQEKIQESFSHFDEVVKKIENSVQLEIRGNNIPSCWSTRFVEKTCTACDAKTFCSNTECKRYSPQVP
jgi:hypothetical protein